MLLNNELLKQPHIAEDIHDLQREQNEGYCSSCLDLRREVEGDNPNYGNCCKTDCK